MKTVTRIILPLLLLVCQKAFATTLLIQDPEAVIKKAPLVVDAVVTEVTFTTVPNSSVGYATIELSISEFIKGSARNIITIRRYGISDKGTYLFTSYTPTYQIGERVIISLRKHENGYYKPQGLYNGVFKIINGVVQGTTIQVEQFKDQIREILMGKRERLSAEVPRFGIQDLKGGSMRLMSDGSHLGGRFVTFNESWNTTTIQFYYNPANAPASTSTVTDRINDAFAVWNGLNLNAVDFSYAGTTSQGQINNTTSVILWGDLDDGVYASEVPNPEEAGPRTKTGSDILFNPDLSWVSGGGSWYFGGSALSSRASSQKDFADILIHELGHTLGLAHSSFSSVVMHGFPYGGYEDITVSPLRTLADGDKAGAVHQHPVQNFSGTLPHSVVLPGPDWSSYSHYNVTNNLTVPSVSTFGLEEDVTLNFTGNYKLRVEGKLMANGTTSNKITFTRSSGTWYGIEFYNASGGQVSYSIIQNAQYGVRVINSYPALAWNTIRYNTVGVQFNNNSFSYGGTLQGNIIEDNFDGVKCYQYSDPAITPSNVIRYNIYNGVYGDATSVPSLGYYYGTGYNSLYWNGTEVWSNYSGTINARYNWWGEPDPTPNVSSNVDWSNYLNYDPNSGMGVVLAKAGASEQRRSNEFAEAVADTVGIAEVNRAHEALLKGEYARALSLFEGIVGTYPDHFSGRRALAFVGRCLQKLNRANETVARRDQLVQNYAGKEIFALSHSLAVGDLIKSEQYAEAIDRCSAILRDFPGTDLAKYALFDLGSIHWYRLADQKTGKQYYRDLIAQWPDDDLAISALATLGEWVPREHALPQPQSEPQLTKSGEVPGQYALLGNYPNPFNPTTTISYALPVRSDVKVVLYNIMGQEIRTYTMQSQAPGHQSITWDGTDANRRPVASGVYLYRISARSRVNDEHFVRTAKLMLLK